MAIPGASRRGQNEKIEFMMTPMIDIVFNLIIFFMLMPSFEAKEGYLPTNLPSTQGQSNKEQVEQNSFRIDLLHKEPWDDEHPENKRGVDILLNRESIPGNADLRLKLRAARDGVLARGGPELLKKAPVTISPDQSVWHKHVVAAFDAAIDAGFVNICFTVPK